MPLWNFDAQSFSQATQCISLLLTFFAHQNLAIKLSSSSQSESKNLKQLMAYVGMDWATALMMTSFPSWECSFSFQVWSFCHNLFFLFKKALFFKQPMKGGRPSYFSYCWLLLLLQRAKSSSFWLVEVFLLKIVAILFEFIN